MQGIRTPILPSSCDNDNDDCPFNDCIFPDQLLPVQQSYTSVHGNLTKSQHYCQFRELPYDIFVSWQILQPQLNNYSNKLFHQKCTINSTNGTLVCDVCQI